MNTIEIGTFIRSRRIEIDLTQKELSEKLLISYQSVSKWERGKNLPTPDLLNDLSEILEVPVNEILNAGEIIETVKEKNRIETFLKFLKDKRILILSYIKNNDNVVSKIREHKKENCKNCEDLMKEKINNRIPFIKSVSQSMIDGF